MQRALLLVALCVVHLAALPAEGKLEPQVRALSPPAPPAALKVNIVAVDVKATGIGLRSCRRWAAAAAARQGKHCTPLHPAVSPLQSLLGRRSLAHSGRGIRALSGDEACRSALSQAFTLCRSSQGDAPGAACCPALKAAGGDCLRQAEAAAAGSAAAQQAL